MKKKTQEETINTGEAWPHTMRGKQEEVRRKPKKGSVFQQVKKVNMPNYRLVIVA